MPLYEYQCLNCKEKFNVFQKISEPHLTQCPKCSGRLEKILGIGGVLTQSTSSPAPCDSCSSACNSTLSCPLGQGCKS